MQSEGRMIVAHRSMHSKIFHHSQRHSSSMACNKELKMADTEEILLFLILFHILCSSISLGWGYCGSWQR
jgi:hypothetical protein